MASICIVTGVTAVNFKNLFTMSKKYEIYYEFRFGNGFRHHLVIDDMLQNLTSIIVISKNIEKNSKKRNYNKNYLIISLIKILSIQCVTISTFMRDSIHIISFKFEK